MKKNENEKKTRKELIKVLRDAEDYLHSLATKVGELRDLHESPHIIEEISKLKREGKVKNISTAWMQRKYKIGYARAARLMDELRAQRVIE
jgi:DNA segregation ATPase FtsK/SpoIIIE-like protein